MPRGKPLLRWILRVWCAKEASTKARRLATRRPTLTTRPGMRQSPQGPGCCGVTRCW
ncbi:MAG: 4-phosphopantetheinyl transferase family protein [Propionibacterium sp.]|nr:4-phosphopantetheinyl transferase family protein [Propionibacterium sp.]